MARTPTNIPDPMANLMPVNLTDAYESVTDCWDAVRPRVPNLISSPGVGKSSLIYQIAEDREFCVVDVRMSTVDPTELNGFPYIWDTPDGRKVASYVPMDIFPVVGTEMPINPKTDRPYKGWVLFLDEFNAGTMLVQAAAYKILLDRMIGMYKLDDRCVLAIAGNLMSDKAITNRLGTATQSRVIHIPIKVCTDTWDLWACGMEDFDHRVISFIKFMPEMLHVFDPNHDDLTFPCPRTWHFMSDIFLKYDTIPIQKISLMAGTVGIGAARAYHAHTEVYKELPDIKKILDDPRGVQFREDPSVTYALAGIIGHNMNDINIQGCLQFLGRLGADHQVTAIRQAIGRDYDLLHNNHMLEWRSTNTKELVRGRG